MESNGCSVFGDTAPPYEEKMPNGLLCFAPVRSCRLQRYLIFNAHSDRSEPPKADRADAATLTKADGADTDESVASSEAPLARAALPAAGKRNVLRSRLPPSSVAS